MISLKPIRSAASAMAYTRGNQVYKNGKILEFTVQPDHDYLHVDAVVQGSYNNAYKVRLRYDLKKDVFDGYQCECEAYFSYSGMCKHCVAAALKLYAQETEDNSNGRQLSTFDEKSGNRTEKKPHARATDTALANIIYASSMKEKARFLQPGLTGQVELVPLFHKQNKKWTLEFKIGAAQKYVVKNISGLVEAVQQNDWVEYGKKLAFYHERSVFTPLSQEIFQLLEQYIVQEKDVMQNYYYQNGYSYYSYMENLTKRSLLLTDEWMVKFAELFAGTSCGLQASGLKPELEFVEKDPALKVKIESREDGGYRLMIPAAELFSGRERICVRTGSTMYVCSPEFSEQMRAIGGLVNGSRTEYAIHPKDASSFCASVLPALRRYTRCEAPEELKQYEPKPCQLQVYLDRQMGQITAKVLCFYGEDNYNLLDPITVSEMHRDFEKESGMMMALRPLFPYIDETRKYFWMSEEDEERVYHLVDEGILQLQQMGEVFISDSLKRVRIVQTPKVTIGITMRGGLLDLELQTGQLPMEEIQAILAGYRRKRKFFRLPDGAFLRLEDNGLAAVAELAEGLDLKGSQLAEGRLKVPGYRSFYLDQILRENGGDVQISRSQEFKALLREMKNVEDSDFEIPEGLKAELRPYQKFGYRWMMTLKKLGFGGILADDMGLGKTVQAIAYLLAQKEENADVRMAEQKVQQAAGSMAPGETEGTAAATYLGLIVCPASLVYNWESEIQRFATSLSAVTITGTAAARKEKIQSGAGDLLLTSYDLLKRDVEFYEGIRFQHMIIDEAQNIKNYTTQAAKAVKAVNSIHRFALTGTPIENSLSELWSIFDFLMPGILSTNKKFKEKYEQPIVTNQDKRVSERLKKMIRPYILRRVKSEVLKELPDKIEKVLYSRMGDEQKKLYDANLQQLLDSLRNQSQEEFRTGKLQILSELTKLRQLCCDPSMVYENYRGDAAKVEACLELIRNAAAGGNQTLLFSQFTTALDIIAQRLDKEKIPYYMLTGSTSKEKRARLVADFNQDKTPVFLISLKAGGTGLNLTAASIVIHLDPWWNMAAQNQATDRAHRIGQKQVVTVYKLIMKDTVEEKILKLQEQKAQLSDEIISEGSIRDTLATKEELVEILQGI